MRNKHIKFSDLKAKQALAALRGKGSLGDAVCPSAYTGSAVGSVACAGCYHGRPWWTGIAVGVMAWRVSHTLEHRLP